MNKLTTSCLLLLLLAGCSDDIEAPTPSPLAIQGEPSKVAIDNDFIDQGQQAIDTLAGSAKQLHAAINEFIENSTDQRLQALQQQWLKTHYDWHRAATYLRVGELYSGLLPGLSNNIANIHQQQIQAGYLDDIEGYPGSGLVNDINLPMTAENLRQQHQLFDTEEVTTGLNAMEFELWYRKLEDFDTNAKTRGNDKNQQPQQRRRTLLALLGELLIEDIQELDSSWSTTAERINTLDSNSIKNLYRQLAIVELQFLRHSLQTPHTAFSHDSSWQTALLDNLHDLASYWSDSPTLKQLKAIAKDLKPATAITEEEHSALREQLSRLIKQLEQLNMQASGE